jgi:enamine deaminase RidA (YjgF/YER057c/UK114 family)
MPLERIQPEGLARPNAYTHVVRSSGSHTLHIAGQVSRDAEGNTIAPGDFAEQVRQALSNLRACVGAGGATMADVASIRTYVVGYEAALHLPALREALGEAFGDTPPANTLLGIQALAVPDLLVEIEALAVIDSAGGNGGGS